MPATQPVKHVLFLCSRNKLRSPTAEAVFAARRDIEVASAGLSSDAEIPCTPELVAWADIIFVMEKSHRAKLSARFKQHLHTARVICLDIPDSFAFMDPALIVLLRKKAEPHLR